jgi:RNA polymerase sigma factor (sigma-70 family)
MQADPKEAKMGKNDPNCTVLAEDEQIFVDEYNKWSQSTKNKKIPKSLNMEAEDVSQEAFIRAWKVFKKAEKPIQNIPAYLSTIRKNFLKSLKKQTRKENPVSKEKADNFPNLPPVTNITDSDTNIYKEITIQNYGSDLDILLSGVAIQKFNSFLNVLLNKLILKEIKNSLPPQIKLIIIYRLNGETYEEIGKKLGIPGNTARKQVERTLSQLVNRNVSR